MYIFYLFLDDDESIRQAIAINQYKAVIHLIYLNL